MNDQEIIIIGGGFAGLAAGVALAGAGRRVRLLEQNPHLGGRARSFLDPQSGTRLDNGQHIFMGCYHAALRFLTTIGAGDRIHFQPNLAVCFADRSGRLSGFCCPRLPAPWHVFWGIIRSDSFTRQEKWQILRLGLGLSAAGVLFGRKDSAGLTVREWLCQQGQSAEVQAGFWDLLAIASMNDRPEVAAASLFERVVRQALFSSPLDSRIGFAHPGLSECYTEAAAAYITSHGGRVETGRRVLSFTIRQNHDGELPRESAGLSRQKTTPGPRWRLEGLCLEDGQTIQAGCIVSAVPWFRLASLLPAALLRKEPCFASCLELEAVPIVSIYLWFDRPVTPEELIGLRGTTIQWLFNKSASESAGPYLISLVISGARGEVSLEKDELIATAMRELRELFPATREARLLRAMVIKERCATFSPRAETESLRPPAVTPVRGLFLGGDWTDTGLPATIEGAVRSGYTAADAVLRAVTSGE
ncbi:MAG: hydroxysqualene dehydroxylase HpnE [Terriglobia bacterium]